MKQPGSICMAVLIGLLPAALSVGARTLQSLEDAAETWYPGGAVQRNILYPTEEQFDRARALAGVEIPERPVYRYDVYREGALVGIVYLDKHRVRTLPETLAVAVSPSGTVHGLEVLAFAEPEEYLPGDAWFDQFREETLHDQLHLNRDIQGISGATLSSRAVTDAVRRVLALHRILSSPEP